MAAGFIGDQPGRDTSQILLMEFLNNSFTLSLCFRTVRRLKQVTEVLRKGQCWSNGPAADWALGWNSDINANEEQQSVWAYLELGRRSLCTAQVCKLWRFLFDGASKNKYYAHWKDIMRHFLLSFLEHLLLQVFIWVPTRHVNHPAVAVFQQVAGLTVNAAGWDAVRGEELGIHLGGFAISPWWWKVLKLVVVEIKQKVSYYLRSKISIGSIAANQTKQASLRKKNGHSGFKLNKNQHRQQEQRQRVKIKYRSISMKTMDTKSQVRATILIMSGDRQTSCRTTLMQV